MFDSIMRLFKTLDRPSPSDIFVPGMPYLFDPGAFYTDAGGRKRVKKAYVRIPFGQDPVVWPSTIPGSKSMDPVFDKEHDNLYLQGENPNDQKIMVEWLANEWNNPPEGEEPRANIIVYRGGRYAVHRLAKIDSDNKGRKWYFKGDNNLFHDPGYARDEGILYVLGLIAL